MNDKLVAPGKNAIERQIDVQSETGKEGERRRRWITIKK